MRLKSKLNLFSKTTMINQIIAMQKLIQASSLLSILSILILAFSPSGSAESEQDALFEKIKKTTYNFRQVTPTLYRSGLISKESVPYLKELGIKTVLTFDNQPKRVAKEQQFLKEAGIESISIPWSGWDYPDDETIQKIHQIMDLPERQPILVHCKHGQERTGVVVATWRISRQNWNVDQAYQEMKACGFRSFQYGHLKKYIYNFAHAHGDQNAKMNTLERIKTEVLSFFYRLRKLNPAYQ